MLAETLIERLTANGSPWGYRYNEDGAAEPTAIAAIALATHQQRPDLVTAALEWLKEIQKDHGGVPILPNFAPYWPTSIALEAWARAGKGAYGEVADRATAYLLDHAGRALPQNDLFGHDSTLVGWSWVDNTHSWVEPTSYAISALREAGAADHARVREGVRLLLDRCLPEGGWNYGNTRVMQNVLRPFPATTGVALVALRGEARTPPIERSLAYLRDTAPTIPAPLSLAWATLGLRAWGETIDLEDALATAVQGRPPTPLHDALALWACPIADEAGEEESP
ncbi:MAG: hypothetical protein AAGE52_13830 [Myxococcota bacterium]